MAEHIGISVPPRAFDLALNVDTWSSDARLRFAFAAQVGYHRGEVQPNAVAIWRRVRAQVSSDVPLLEHVHTVAIEAGIAFLGLERRGRPAGGASAAGKSLVHHQRRFRHRARVYRAGETDSALVWLERSSWQWPHRANRFDPALDPLRADPRFQRLALRINREMGIK